MGARARRLSAPLCIAAALVALVGLAGCAGDRAASPARDATPPIPFVDAHVHLDYSNTVGRPWGSLRVVISPTGLW